MGSTGAMSTVYDMNAFQLCLVLQSAIPRPDVLHKIVNFIKTTRLDGKAFMGLNNKRLADLASHDPLTISRFQGLRVAQPQDIQLLLESRGKRPRSPEPTTTTQDETHGEESIEPVFDPDTQPHPADILPLPSNPDSRDLAPDTTITTEAEPILANVGTDTQISTDAAQTDPNGSSLNRESPTPDEPPTNLEPAVAAELEFASPIDPHSVPLPQPHNSELDLLNVEEDDISDDEAFSADEAVGSDLEAYADGLTSGDDSSDDESQAWSLVGDEEIGELHVSIETLQAESSLPVDATHENHIGPLSVTPEDSSIVHAPNGSVLSAARSPQIGPDPGIDQLISADVDSSLDSEQDGQHSKDNVVENSHQRGAGLSSLTPPLPEENGDDVSPTMSGDIPNPVNVPDPEISGLGQDATTAIDGSVDTGQTSQDPVSGPDPLQTDPVVSALEQPSALPVTPGFTEDDQPKVASVVDETPAAGPSDIPDIPDISQASETVSTEESVVNDLLGDQLDSRPVANEAPATNLEETQAEQPLPSVPEEAATSPFESAAPEDDRVNTAPLITGPPNTEENTPEVTYLSDPVSIEEPSETVDNDLLQEQPVSKPVTNDIPTTNPESTHAEQPLPSLFNPAAHNPSELPTAATVVEHSVAEELDPINFEDSAPFGIQVTHAEHSPVSMSVELDSDSGSPSSSARSVFGDSPFSNRLYSEFLLVPPVNPGLCLDKCNPLLFCEGVCDDYSAFLTSPSIDITHLLPFSSHVAGYEETNLTADNDDPAANELRLVDHPLPVDDTEPDDPMSFLSLDDFFYDPFALDESTRQNGEPAFSSNDNLIDLLDELDVHAESPAASESILVPVESPLLDEDMAEEDGSSSLMGDSVPVVNFPGASGMNEGQLADENQVEENSILSNEIVQQASDEASSEMCDPVGMNEGQLIVDDQVEERSMPPNEPAQQASNEATSAITGLANNQEETVQYASNESTPDEPLSWTATLPAVEPSRFKGLPPIDTSMTSLTDDLSAYMSPEEYTPNPIALASYPTPFSSRPRLSPGSPGSPRTLFPMQESFASERAFAIYAKRLHDALERPGARSIAIQTNLDSLDLHERTREENPISSNVVSASVSPLSIFSPFRQLLWSTSA